MKTKTVIAITIILTLLVAYSGLSIYNYQTKNNQIAYDNGVIIGKLYTADTGNIAYLYVNEESNMTEMGEITVSQVCNNLIAQQQQVAQ